MSTRSDFIPAVDAYESFLTVSYILFNPMFRTHPAICGTKYARTFVFCIWCTIRNLTMFWLPYSALISTLASFAWHVISPRWFVRLSCNPLYNSSLDTIRAFYNDLYPFFFIFFFLFFHILYLISQPLSAAFGFLFPNGKPQKLWKNFA
mgnify:FL=1